MNRIREERSGGDHDLLSMLTDVEKELLKIPGVAFVRVGIKKIKGRHTNEPCFRVYVDRKKKDSDIPPQERIPAVIKNIKTDVLEIPRNAFACGSPDTGKYRPLSGGIKIMSARSDTVGTLGCIAIDGTSGEDVAVLLSSYHVLMGNGEEKGHQVAQPDFCCESCCCRCGEIAKLERGAWAEKNVDAAIATLTGDNADQWTNEVLGLGPVSSLPLDAAGKPILEIEKRHNVFKRGADSSFTEGIIDEVSIPVDIDYPTKDGIVTKSFTGLMVISPKDYDKPFSRRGDSGAVILNHLNQVIGLIIGDNGGTDDTGKFVEATETYVSPIQDVLKALNIRIPDTGTLESMNLRSAGDTTRIPKRDILDELEKTIEQYEEGPILIGAFKKHRHEVMQLIITDREVKVTWNRFHGPSFAAHLMEKVKDPAYKVPTEIGGISYQRLLSKMSVVLEKKGSPEMRKDIEEYSAKAFMLIAGLLHSFNE